MNEPRPFLRSPAALAALGALVVLFSSEAISSRLGGNPSDFVLFLGRFHPLAVHLPIGFVLLVVAAEALSLSPRYRSRVDPVLGLALPALLAVTLAAFLLGQFLARSGDFAPRVLSLHRRLEFFATAGVCACVAAWAFHARAGSERARLVYRAVLGATVTVMSIGAHFGGTMTRGETYLARYAPGPLKPLLGGAGPEKSAKDAHPAERAGAEPTLFANAVAPILVERCSGCHGAEKVKGGLRLDSFSRVMRGGENGPAVAPGAPEDSPLLTFVLLPVEDDEHMPPKDKPQPTAAEIAVLRFWIERGANDKLLLRDALPPQEARSVLEQALRLAPAAEKPASSAGAPPSPAPANSNTPTAVTSGAGNQPTPAAKTAAAHAPEPGAPASPEPAPASPAPVTEAPAAAASAMTAPRGRSALAILASSCESCHGAKKQKGKLRVDSLAALIAGGATGPAVMPGKPGESALIQRLNLPLADDDHMPPKKEPQLTSADIQTLTAWVRGLGPGEPVTSAPSTMTSGSGKGTSPTASDALPASEPGSAAPADGASSGSAPATTAEPAAPTANSDAPLPTGPLTEAELARLPARVVLYPDGVGPMLVDRCGDCHAGQKPAMGLRVDSHAALMKGGLSGPAVLAGKPDQSLLLQRVLLPLDDGDHMPPDDEPQPTGAEVALLRTWIEHGAALTYEVDPRELSPDSQRTLLARAPASWTAPSQLPAAPKEAGCAACSVARAGSPLGALGAASSLLFSLVLRRQRRSSSSARRPPVPI